MKLHRGAGVSGSAIGPEERAGPDQVVGELVVFTHVAVNGLGFVGKSKGTSVVARNRESVAVGESKTERRES